jgi:hypothetical protein
LNIDTEISPVNAPSFSKYKFWAPIAMSVPLKHVAQRSKLANGGQIATATRGEKPRPAFKSLVFLPNPPIAMVFYSYSSFQPLNIAGR